MNRSISLAILDVGHGNSAVLMDTDGVVVIDAGPGSALLEYLREENIDKLDVILISHADKDHIAGLLAILGSENLEIGRVLLNSDAAKSSILWDDLLYTLSKAHSVRDLDFNIALTVRDTGSLDQGSVHIEILAPTQYLAGHGPGSNDRKGRKVTTNSISAVIRLVYEGEPVALFAADLDGTGLENLIEEGLDCSAPILVYPHHGGLIGSGDINEFADKLSRLVNPDVVIFSIGRNKYNNPQPDIVREAKKNNPKLRIACTQLSKRCSSEVPNDEPKHLTNKFAQGRATRHCCGGTFLVEIGNGPTLLSPSISAHSEFISTTVKTPLCQA